MLPFYSGPARWSVRGPSPPARTPQAGSTNSPVHLYTCMYALGFKSGRSSLKALGRSRFRDSDQSGLPQKSGSPCPAKLRSSRSGSLASQLWSPLGSLKGLRPDTCAASAGGRLARSLWGAFVGRSNTLQIRTLTNGAILPGRDGMLVWAREGCWSVLTLRMIACVAVPPARSSTSCHSITAPAYPASPCRLWSLPLPPGDHWRR